MHLVTKYTVNLIRVFAPRFVSGLSIAGNVATLLEILKINSCLPDQSQTVYYYYYDDDC
jgi:hypothetical protein